MGVYATLAPDAAALKPDSGSYARAFGGGAVQDAPDPDTSVSQRVVGLTARRR